MKHLIFFIFFSTFFYGQNIEKKEQIDSIFIYVEKSYLKEFKFNQINLKEDIHFRLSWPSSGNFKKNILKKSENGYTEKGVDFINGRSYNLHLKSKNKSVSINQTKLITLLNNRNVLYFSEFNLYEIENLMNTLKSDTKIYVIYNDFKRKVKIYECIVAI